MLHGSNLIGNKTSAAGSETLRAFSTVTGDFLPGNFTIATEAEALEALAKARAAFAVYKKTTPEERARFLDTIADEIAALGADLIERTMQETGLPQQRLLGEQGRTTGQLRMFAALLREGSWVEAVIDTALPDRKPLPRADIRKVAQPLGPVLVFAASNFPFAFSTAGGDTASALAAGCPVIVKAHTSHLGTNELMAGAIQRAAQKCGMPDGVFSSLIGEGSTLGQMLAKHPDVKAIGFTGSYRAGMALYKASANDRKAPIPVYAEMSSINPVLVLPEKSEQEWDTVAAQLSASITLGAGQFCTNPGLLFVLENSTTDLLVQKLADLLKAAPEATMLNKSICGSYHSGIEKLLALQGVRALVQRRDAANAYAATATLFEVTADTFIANPDLQEEVFGPSSLIIRCSSVHQLNEAIASMHGQLTGTVMGTDTDVAVFAETIDLLTERVGRLVFNGVPTGVEVGQAMVHGGPFPATTDSRSTSVGADAIKRFVRPVCYQDCPQEHLPDALKDSNPLGIMRKINSVLTREPVDLAVAMQTAKA
ncbi:aldehyde dehydrogenase (NADP(+)) [Pseudocnuella soli]|uniref:aldehyde dehydrogenase (NADP(+)) n=1 Tax=Pseudocnuella soli TaxID=2502779 RepID=UPI001053D25F|nr:aldehyde dehydrogenase (NADP(+)) [Pseudocnuella soli]